MYSPKFWVNSELFPTSPTKTRSLVNNPGVFLDCGVWPHCFIQKLLILDVILPPHPPAKVHHLHVHHSFCCTTCRQIQGELPGVEIFFQGEMVALLRHGCLYLSSGFGIHPSKTDMTMEKQLFEDVLVSSSISPIEKWVFFYCHVCFRGCTKNLPKTTVCPKVLNITLWNFPKALRFVSRGPHFAPAPNKGLQRLRLGRWLELQPRSLSGWVSISSSNESLCRNQSDLTTKEKHLFWALIMTF